MTLPLNSHNLALQADLHWLKTAISCRMEQLVNEPEDLQPAITKLLPMPEAGPNHYTRNVMTHIYITPELRLMALLSYAAKYYPYELQPLVYKDLRSGKQSAEIGGLVHPEYGTLIPTVKTGMFIWSGSNIVMQHHILEMVDDRESRFRKEMTGYVRLYKYRDDSDLSECTLEPDYIMRPMELHSDHEN